MKLISYALSLISWLGPDRLKAANEHSISQCGVGFSTNLQIGFFKVK